MGIRMHKEIAYMLFIYYKTRVFIIIIIFILLDVFASSAKLTFEGKMESCYNTKLKMFIICCSATMSYSLVLWLILIYLVKERMVDVGVVTSLVVLLWFSTPCCAVARAHWLLLSWLPVGWLWLAEEEQDVVVKSGRLEVGLTWLHVQALFLDGFGVWSLLGYLLPELWCCGGGGEFCLGLLVWWLLP